MRGCHKTRSKNSVAYNIYSVDVFLTIELRMLVCVASIIQDIGPNDDRQASDTFLALISGSLFNNGGNHTWDDPAFSKEPQCCGTVCP